MFDIWRSLLIIVQLRSSPANLEASSHHFLFFIHLQHCSQANNILLLRMYATHRKSTPICIIIAPFYKTHTSHMISLCFQPTLSVYTFVGIVSFFFKQHIFCVATVMSHINYITCSMPNSKSLTSFSVTAGKSTRVPGRFTPFRLPNIPPFSTKQTNEFSAAKRFSRP